MSSFVDDKKPFHFLIVGWGFNLVDFSLQFFCVFANYNYTSLSGLWKYQFIWLLYLVNFVSYSITAKYVFGYEMLLAF